MHKEKLQKMQSYPTLEISQKQQEIQKYQQKRNVKKIYIPHNPTTEKSKDKLFTRIDTTKNQIAKTTTPSTTNANDGTKIFPKKLKFHKNFNDPKFTVK
jgi:hypothetical protein